MKLLKEILGQESIYEYRILSASEKGNFHTVRLLKNGELECDCVAGLFKKVCRHKKEVQDSLKEEKVINV